MPLGHAPLDGCGGLFKSFKLLTNLVNDVTLIKLSFEFSKLVRGVRMSNKALVKFNGVSKVYQLGETAVHALNHISISINEGDFAVISGPSGSGKSTLLNILGCIDKPTSGQVSVNGIDITAAPLESLYDLRLNTFGFVYQSFNLVPVLTAFENVELPLIFKASNEDRKAQILKALSAVGLADRVKHRPNKLSGGQRQRVAIARAIVGNPKILIADEPTANLDSKTSESIIELLQDLNENHGVTVIVASHDPIVIKKARQHLEVCDGEIQ